MLIAENLYLSLDYLSKTNTFREPNFLIMSIIRIILAIFIPPLGVFLTVGIKADFWINILLTLLGYLPGIIHAVWIIAKHDK